MATGAPTPSLSVPGWNLAEVFRRFYLKFQALPEPRSVAEARITTSEVVFLREWLSEKAESPGLWCWRTWQETVEGDVTASSREMFGALFLILASEIIREECNEESVWPAISSLFKQNKGTHSVLFWNGHPTEDCKAAIAAGAERLGLRSLIDRVGKQEYFGTLKLQIGFTFKGATQGLPKWLRGISQPLAVKILLGIEPGFEAHKSTEFRSLWRVLQEYQRDQVSVEYATSFLQNSPWVRSTWVPELLTAAKERYTGTSEESGGPEGAAERVGAICEAVLLWQPPRKPELFLRFDRDRLTDSLGDADSVTVAVDRQVVGRWTKQESGAWWAEFERLPCQPEHASKPNLRPQILSITGGNTAIEIDLLSELELLEPLLIFDAATGRHVSGPRLDPNRDYLLLCDPDMELAGARAWKGKDRSVFLLSGPVAPDTRVLCGGELYWQPQIGTFTPKRSFALRLECVGGETIKIGDPARLVVRGVPEDAREVRLFIGHADYCVLMTSGEWRTESDVRITAEMALGDEPVRVRVSGPDFTRKVPARMSLNLRGVAVIETDECNEKVQWKILNPDRPMNRAGGIGRARVFAGARDGELCEGAFLVTRRLSKELDIGALRGWGDCLFVCRGSKADLLVSSVEDHGCVDSWAGLGNDLRLRLRTPIKPSTSHAVWIWRELDGPPFKVAWPEVKSDEDGFEWRLPKPFPPVVAAVVYGGVCLGAYWNLSEIASALTRPPTEQRFGLLRWLKIPVLNRRLREDFERMALRAPLYFARAWLGDSALPNGFVHRQGEKEELGAVVRTVLWNYVEQNEARMSTLVRSIGGDGRQESLIRLSSICPALVYNFARLSHGPTRRDSQRFIRHMRDSLLERSSLTTLAKDCAELIGITEEVLLASVSAYGKYLEGRAVQPPGAHDLKRLGERERGRRYLSAALLSRLLERGPNL